MVETVAEHKIDFEYLTPGGWILDIGCFGFDFYKHMKLLGYNVVGVDIQIMSNEFPYRRVAISNTNGVAYIEYNHDKQATRLSKKETPYPIQCETIDRFSEHFCVSTWDLIKADCEGSEYEIIMSLERAPAKSLSVEFHLHTDVYGENEVKQMVEKLISLGYEVVSHEKSVMHGMKPNYWSSLFIMSHLIYGK
jgi:FkbM family methyltransferase